MEGNVIRREHAKQTTYIVVPCFNEAKRLPAADFVSFVQKHPAVHFLFVNDGSTDGTAALLAELVRQSPETLHSLTLEKNMGKGEAVRQGLLQVLKVCPDCAFAGYWDADLSTPLELIPDFLEAFSCRPDCQVILGSRIRAAGRNIERNDARHYIGRIFSTIAQLFLQTHCYDTQCGAKVFLNTQALQQIIRDPFVSRWLFDIELLLRLRNTLRITSTSRWHRAVFELPLLTWIEKGDSRIQLLDFFRIPCDLLRIYAKRTNQTTAAYFTTHTPPSLFTSRSSTPTTSVRSEGWPPPPSGNTPCSEGRGCSQKPT